MCDIYSMSREKPWFKSGAQLGIPDKSRSVKRLVVCNGWDSDPMNVPMLLSPLSPKVRLV